MVKKIIIINGPAQAGKDTFIDMCRQQLAPKSIAVSDYSAIDQVRGWAKMLGWDGIKDAKGRSLLFDLMMASVAYNDGIKNYLLNKVKETESGLIFLHIRQPEEIDKILAALPETKLLHIERPGQEILQNGAENVTRGVSYDYEIENDGDLSALELKVSEFIRWLEI